MFNFFENLKNVKLKEFRHIKKKVMDGEQIADMKTASKIS